MSVRDKLARIADTGAAHGTFRTSNPASQQTEEERATQEQMVNNILDDLGLSPSDMTELKIGKDMQFVLPPNSQNAAVVSKYNGWVVEDVPSLGTRVAVPIHFGMWRKLRAINNPFFFAAAGAMVVCGAWIGWQWLTNDDLWGEISFGYNTVART